MAKHYADELRFLGAQVKYETLRAQLAALVKEFPSLTTLVARTQRAYKRHAEPVSNGNGASRHKEHVRGVGGRVRALLEAREQKRKQDKIGKRKYTRRETATAGARPDAKPAAGTVIFLKEWLVGEAILHVLMKLGPMTSAEITENLTANHFTNTASKNLKGLVHPTMTHLLKAGRVKSREVGGVRVWTVTKAGERALDEATVAGRAAEPKRGRGKKGKKGRRGDGVGLPGGAPVHLPPGARHAVLGDTGTEA